jgi:hypothetical protein
LKVNWFSVIDELEERGVSMRSMAIHSQVSLGTIYYWRAGGEPKYRNGHMLLDLYMRQVGKEPPLATTSRST